MAAEGGAGGATETDIDVTAPELFLCDQGLTQVPRDVAEQRGPYVTSLNLSENALKTGEGLELFVKLDTLVLDKNGLENLDGFPKLPTVTVLWMNDNKVSDLPTFYTQVRELFPALNFFCLMRNPASPPFAAMSEGDAKKIRQFRLFTIYSLPTLQFLDSSPVSPEERADAKKRGKYMAVRKPSRSVTSVGSIADARAAGAAPSGSSTPTPPPGDATPPASAAAAGDDATKRKPSAFLGLGRSSYDGRHSEGNRFIVDADL